MLISLNHELLAQEPVVFEEWASTKGVQEYFYKNVTKTDASRNVYVAGATLNSNGDYDLLITKFDRRGSLLWTDTIAGPAGGHDFATDLDFDQSGNVVVSGSIATGAGQGNDMLAVKYNDSGTEIWRFNHDHSNNNEGAASLVIDQANNIYLTGATQQENGYTDIITLKIDSTSALQWEELYDGNNLHDAGVRIEISGSRVIVTGGSQLNSLSWKVLAMSYLQVDGTLAGYTTSSGTDPGVEEVTDLVIDENDNIYIAGSTINVSTGYDMLLIKLDEDLNIEWTKEWDGDGMTDKGSGVRVAPNGDVYLCGTTETATGDDIALLKFSSDGSSIWEEQYDSEEGGDDAATAMEWQDGGHLYVTGNTHKVSNLDYLTMKYDSTGSLIWDITYNSPYNNDDKATNLAIDDEGDIIVSGQCEKNDSVMTYYTVKYVELEFVDPLDTDSIPGTQYFVPNVGQVFKTTDSLTMANEVKFVNRNDHPAVYVQDDRFSYIFALIDTLNPDSLAVDSLHRVDMVFNKKNKDQKIYPLGQKEYFENFYLSYMPKFSERVSPYNRLVSFNVWNNIDVVYSNNGSGLKFYFVCKPGFDSDDLTWNYSGADTLIINGDGKLELHTSLGNVVLSKATAWQIDGSGNTVNLGWQAQYNFATSNVEIQLGSFDTSKTLILSFEKQTGGVVAASEIPEWSTFFGGTNGDVANDLTTDQEDIYMTGATYSYNSFPITGLSIFQENHAGSLDAFIANFNSDYSRKWVTYFGGENEDRGLGISDFEDLIFVCGDATTESPEVFTYSLDNSSESYTSLNIYGYSFVAGFGKEFGTREWSSYIGGVGYSPKKVSCDENGNIYLVGDAFYSDTFYDCESSDESGFPICNPGGGAFVQGFHAAGGFSALDGFIMKFNNQTSLVWSTLFGGGGDDRFRDLCIDDDNEKLYVVGSTTSSRVGTFDCEPTLGPFPTGFPLCDNGSFFQDDLNGNNSGSLDDGVILRFSLSGNLEWSTFFGGSESDAITSVGVNSGGDIYVTGITTTNFYGNNNCDVPTNNGFPTCSSAFSYNESFGGFTDSFIASFKNGEELVWSSFFGGSIGETIDLLGPKLVVDGSGNIWIAGSTSSGSNSSSSFPIINDANYYNQPAHSNVNDANYKSDCYVSKFTNLHELDWSTYFGGSGGSGNDYLGGIAISDNNKLFICGQTDANTVFPLNCPSEFAYCDAAFPSGSDAFIAQLKTDDLVGIESIDGNETSMLKFDVFPNPTTGVMQIVIHYSSVHYSMNNSISISIYDRIGRNLNYNIDDEKLRSSVFYIDLSNEPDGLYLIRAQLGPQIVTKRVVKQ